MPLLDVVALECFSLAAFGLVVSPVRVAVFGLVLAASSLGVVDWVASAVWVDVGCVPSLPRLDVDDLALSVALDFDALPSVVASGLSATAC